MIDLVTWNLSVPVHSPPYTVETSKLVDGFKDQYFHSDTGTLKAAADLGEYLLKYS